MNDEAPVNLLAKTTPERSLKERVANARYLLKPSRNAALTLADCNDGFLAGGFGEMSLALSEMVRPVQDGNMAQVEALLFSQGLVLDGIFNRLCRMAIAAENQGVIQARYLDLALRAQKQCRDTAEALLQHKARDIPAAVMIGQQNIAGQMQVNNGTPAKSGQGKMTNGLLEDSNGSGLDTGRQAAAASKCDTGMEAVGAQQRPENT